MRPINYKNLMLAGLLVVGAGSSHQSMAFGGGPVVGAAQSCNIPLSLPDNVDNYYTSEDCKHVYLVPKRGGEMELIFADILMSRNSCESIDDLRSDIRTYEQSKNRLLKQRSYFIPGSQSYSDYTDHIIKETTLLSDAKDALKRETFDSQGKRIPGAFLKMGFQKVSYNSIADKAITLNKVLFQKEGVNFHMAPISESFLSIVNSSIYSDVMSSPPVVASYIPLQKYENGDPNILTYLFNGSASGELYLSAEKGCELLNRFGNTLSLVDSQELKNYLSVNHTYTVPLTTSVGYEAKIINEYALDELLKYSKTKSKFSVKEFKDHTITGGTNEAFVVKINTGEMSSDMRERLSQMEYFNELIENITTDMAERFLDLMAQHQLLTVESPDLEAPEAGVVQQARVGYRCHTSSSWGGLRKKRNCGNYTYHVAIDVDGQADRIRKIRQQLAVELTHSMNISDVLYRYHTSSMDYVPQPKINENK